MKTFSIKNNYLSSTPSNVGFKAGLTPKFMREIQTSKITEINNKFAKRGIITDFKENKVIAWCCDKTTEIFEQLNQKYNLKLSLPKGIFIENFKDLNLDSAKTYGFCNLFPTHIKKNSNEIVPSRTLFFNSFEDSSTTKTSNEWLQDWNFINEISDIRHITKQSASDFFLDIFIHEFIHAAHEDRLIKKIGTKDLSTTLAKIKDKKQTKEYFQKYGEKVSEICNYAANNPLDAIACDISRLIANCLDKETLLPVKNPFTKSPYEHLSFFKRINIRLCKDRTLKEILKDFWNGKFD